MDQDQLKKMLKSEDMAKQFINDYISTNVAENPQATRIQRSHFKESQLQRSDIRLTLIPSSFEPRTREIELHCTVWLKTKKTSQTEGENYYYY